MVEGKTRISVCVGGGRAWGLVMSNLNEVPYWSCYRDPHRCGWLFDLMTGFLLPDSTSHPLPVHSSTICCWKKNLSGLWKQRFVTVVTLWSSALSREPITVVTPCVQSSEALSPSLPFSSLPSFSSKRQWRMPAPVPPSPDPPVPSSERRPGAATASATSPARRLWPAGPLHTPRTARLTSPRCGRFWLGGWTFSRRRTTRPALQWC